MKKIYIISIILSIVLIAKAYSQSWETSGTNLITSSSTTFVGIGTDNPSQPLEVYTPNPKGLKLTSSYNNSTLKECRLLLGHYTNSEPDVAFFGAVSYGTLTEVRFGGGYGLNNSATVIRFLTGITNTTRPSIERMRIDNIGNVGIANTNPLEKLDIVGNIKATGNIYTTTGSMAIGITNAGTHKLYVVGTSYFDNVVKVNGKITAEEIEVIPSVTADHVFSSGYKLMPLNEVESFINQNKHLPEIPSANTMCENGINLGEMQGKLLQKVEELTLYTIQLQKRIEELESKLKGKE